MAAPNWYNNGPGATTGDDIATAERAFVINNGFVWYLNNSSSTALDAAASGGALDGGRRRELPLATLAQAHTNASAGDIICIGEGHAETLSGAQTFNKAGITIVGEGSGSTRPRFTCSGAVAMFDVTAANVRFRNIYFPASTAAATARVRIATAGCHVHGCYFEIGASDTNRALSFVTGAGNCRVSGGTRFVVTAANTAAGLEVVNAMTGLDLDDVVFDGGSVGYGSYAFQGTAAVTSLFWNNVDFINGADFHIATASSGHGTLDDVTGSIVGRIDS